MRNESFDLDVSRETLDRLTVYADLLERWNPRINLVSKASLADLWPRHIQDSAQLVQLAPREATSWVDLGSGGGFPGLVAAIITGTPTTLIESDQRKSAFLRTVARETGTDCTVLTSRIEQAPAQDAQVLSARALADLDILLDYTLRHMSPTGVALFPKGATWKKEVDNARLRWKFDLEAIKSKTQPEAAILRISGVARE